MDIIYITLEAVAPQELTMMFLPYNKKIFRSILVHTHAAVVPYFKQPIYKHIKIDVIDK